MAMLSNSVTYCITNVMDLCCYLEESRELRSSTRRQILLTVEILNQDPVKSLIFLPIINIPQKTWTKNSLIYMYFLYIIFGESQVYSEIKENRLKTPHLKKRAHIKVKIEKYIWR